MDSVLLLYKSIEFDILNNENSLIALKKAGVMSHSGSSESFRPKKYPGLIKHRFPN